MLCLEDCIALCGLTEDEILAIAEHENLNEMVAAELGRYLVSTPEGELRIKAILREDLAAARARGDRRHELALKLLLREFILKHPGCEDRHRVQLGVQPERREGAA